MKRKLLIGTGILALLAAIVASGFYYVTGLPLYTPGNVRAEDGLDAPLEPPHNNIDEIDDVGLFKVTRNVSLYYFTQGQGEPVLVIHGGPGFPPAKPWPALTKASSQHRFIYYHQRGCGKSTRPIIRPQKGNFHKNLTHVNRQLGLATHIADIERIRRILKQKKLILVGHSFGAYLASLYAAEFPERVKKLVLLSPAPLIEFPPKDGGLYRQVAQLLPAAMQAEYSAFQKRYFDFSTLFEKSEDELAALNREFVHFFVAATKTRGWTPPPSTGIPNNGGWMVHAMFLSGGRNHDYSVPLKRVKAPVLVLHGANDLQSAAASRLYTGYFPNATFEIINGAGHFAFSSRPDAVAKLLSTFFKTRVASTAASHPQHTKPKFKSRRLAGS